MARLSLANGIADATRHHAKLWSGRGMHEATCTALGFAPAAWRDADAANTGKTIRTLGYALSEGDKVEVWNDDESISI